MRFYDLNNIIRASWSGPEVTLQVDFKNPLATKAFYQNFFLPHEGEIQEMHEHLNLLTVHVSAGNLGDVSNCPLGIKRSSF